jgi:hypothetical protein
MNTLHKVQSIKDCSDGVSGAVTPYGLVGGYRRFEGTCFQYLQVGVEKDQEIKHYSM